MSRMPRIQIEGAVYYLMPAGNHDGPIFRYDEDYIVYLELLARYKNKHNFKLFAYCLTPDSINLLIEPSGNATISQIMHDLNPNYAKYFNEKYMRTGRLFQERYRMVLIEKAPNLLKMTAYIHLRPKLLHLTDDISGYKYTSFLTYLTEERRKPGTELSNGAQSDKLNMLPEVAYILSCLKDKSYQQFVNEMGAGEVEELNKALEKEKVIGSEDFRQKAESLIKIGRGAPEPEAAVQPVPIEKPVALPQPMLIQMPDALPQPIPIQKPDAVPQPEPIRKPDAVPQPIPIEKPSALPQPIPVGKPKTTSRSDSNIWISLVAACLVILSFIFAMFFAYTNIERMRENMKQEMDTVSKDLSNAYEAKLASCRTELNKKGSE